jgi:hypothetical protein
MAGAVREKRNTFRIVKQVDSEYYSYCESSALPVKYDNCFGSEGKNNTVELISLSKQWILDWCYSANSDNLDYELWQWLGQWGNRGTLFSEKKCGFLIDVIQQRVMTRLWAMTIALTVRERIPLLN